MNRPQATITIISISKRQPVTLDETTERTVAVPQGETGYWSAILAARARAVCLAEGLETPHLPYLGQIACPNDELAKAWLTDQHGGR